MSEKQNCDCIDIQTAAEILELGITQARCVLQAPDKVVLSDSGKIQYLYCRTRVELLSQKRKCDQCERGKLKNTRCCYICHRRFKQNELTSNMCADCQAFKWVRNFAYHGDCVCNPLDSSRISTIEGAIKRFRCHLSRLEKRKQSGSQQCGND